MGKVVGTSYVFSNKGASRPAKLVSEGKKGAPIECALWCVILLLASQVYGQEPKIMPEWKDHFNATPVIENCVFERRIEDGSATGKTNLYQFRYQSNAFMLREIRNLDEAASNQTAIMNVYAGHYGSNYWAIGPGEILRLFPNSERMMKERKNGDAALVYSAETRIYSALYYGINGLDPTTVKWSGETKFAAVAISGESLSGEVLETSRGRPTLLEWHFDQRPSIHFMLEYGYDLQLGLSYYPSEIRLYRKEDGKRDKSLSATHKIFVLNRSATPLGEDIFSATSHLGSRVPTIVFTNNDIYEVAPRGNLAKVLPMSAAPPAGLGNRATKTIRLLFFGFLALSLLGGSYLIWRQHKNNNKQKG